MCQLQERVYLDFNTVDKIKLGESFTRYLRDFLAISYYLQIKTLALKGPDHKSLFPSPLIPIHGFRALFKPIPTGRVAERPSGTLFVISLTTT